MLYFDLDSTAFLAVIKGLKQAAISQLVSKKILYVSYRAFDCKV